MGLLYETNQKIIDIARRAIEVEVDGTPQMVDCVTGELLTDELASAEITKTDMLLSIAKEVKNLEAEQNAYLSEIENLKKRIVKAKGKAETLKGVINRFGYKTNVSDAQASIKWRKGTERVEIANELEIPQEYMKSLGWKPDKKSILTAMKNGETVKGCVLVRADDTFSIS
jgi:predicted  nucleic acid-binding Zn-ribbon protein